MEVLRFQIVYWVEQATDPLKDPDEYGDCDNLGLEDLFAERTEEGLEKRPQTQEMDSGDEASPICRYSGRYLSDGLWL